MKDEVIVMAKREKIQPPSESASLNSLLEYAVDRDASDLHIRVGLPPKIRLAGSLVDATKEPMSLERIENSLLAILTEDQKERFLSTGDLDFIYDIPGVSRFRVNYFKYIHGMGGAFRTIPQRIRTIEQLNLPSSIRDFAELRSGLVLVTGPTGCGKSTTLAALIGHINNTFRRHIVTIEDPIEYMHYNKKCIINQRQVGNEANTFVTALKASLHQDPEVLLIGEMRDYETIRLVVTAAETGVLVFATLHTNSAEKTLNRIIDVFPSGEQSRVRAMLSESLRGVIAQNLLKTRDGRSRVPAVEVLFVTAGVAHLIRQGKIMEIVSLMQAGKSQGMITMDDSLWTLMREGSISPETAYLYAENKRRFEKFAKGALATLSKGK
jgi:twitching motility protein PilT